MYESIAFFMSSFVQLTVVLLLPLRMDLWKATLTQQRVQWCSTDVTQGWFQRGGGQLCALGMGGVQTLLSYAAQWVCTNSISE